MENLEDIFEYIKCVRFLEDFTAIKPNSGIRHRLTGNGTNKTDKNKGLTDNDKAGLTEGLQTFVNNLQTLIDKNKV